MRHAEKLAAYRVAAGESDATEINAARIREFDDLITAKIHGFADAIDYYRPSVAPCRCLTRLLNRR